MNKVYPYKKIIPEELYKDLFKIFLLLDPDSRPRPSEKSNSRKPHKDTSRYFKNIDSKIISVQHSELISKWIDRLEINDDIKNP